MICPLFLLIDPRYDLCDASPLLRQRHCLRDGITIGKRSRQILQSHQQPLSEDLSIVEIVLVGKPFGLAERELHRGHIARIS